MRPLALMLFVACDSGPLLVDIDDSTVPVSLSLWDTHAALGEAVAYWRGCGFSVEKVATGGDVTVSFHELPNDDIGRQYPTKIWLQPTVGLFSVNPSTCKDQVLLVELLKHELGHSLGLHHEPEENAVMYQWISLCRVKTWDEACQR